MACVDIPRALVFLIFVCFSGLFSFSLFFAILLYSVKSANIRIYLRLEFSVLDVFLLQLCTSAFTSNLKV